MRHCGILLLWCAFLFGYGISVGTLYRTEALRAIIGREALHGSWLAPMLYGEPFLTKPPGMYAAIAVVSAIFGEVTTVTARLPSVFAATITVFFFYFTFRRLFERRLVLAAAMLMPVSFLWLERAPSAEIDMLQLMWVSAALLCFFRAVEMEESPFTFRVRALGWWVSALLCVAAGFLTKWTAPTFFYLTVIAMLAWRRRLDLLFRWRHLLALSGAVALCAGWALLVAMQVGWSTLCDAFISEASQRFAPRYAGKPYPYLESLAHPFEVLAANLPWSLFALYACRPSFYRRWDQNGQRLLQLLHCWTWPNLLFWSLPAQHHVRYSLPMCPGVVGLGVMVVIAWARGLERETASRALLIAAVVAWSAVKIVFVEAVLPPRTESRHVREAAARLREFVPEGETLFIGKLKDEGILFYYEGPVRRFRDSALLVQPPFYALLTDAEWQQAKDSNQVKMIESFRDQQGASIVLVQSP